MDEEAVVRNKADVIMERKLRLVKEQGSIVLSPKMRDLHLLTQMLFTTDTAINRMRMNAGTARMPLSGLQAAHERIMRFTARVRAFTGALGGSGFFVAPGTNPMEKEILARRRNAYVFIPKTAEGAAIADLFVSLDSAYFEFKIKSPLRDISKLGEAIDAMKGIVREFRELTSDFAAIANLRFVEPEGLSGYLKSAQEKEQGATGEEA
jgi:hypothetical protein